MNTPTTGEETGSTMPTAIEGRLIAGRYRLLEKIGEGGAAEVFCATDERLQRRVAMKLLRSQYVQDPTWRKRFQVEARAAASLQHPNIVDVYDFGEEPDGTVFIVMPFIVGLNLREVLSVRGRLTPSETVALGRQVCMALAAAHARGLVHRDVKPQNILMDMNSTARLTDFGIVKVHDGDALTQVGIAFGTAAYLSPEQAMGSVVGALSDIYSLGCVLYEALAGRPPFTGQSPASVAYKQVWEQPMPLHDLAPGVPNSLESLVMRCLSKGPADRSTSAEVLEQELRCTGVGTGPLSTAVPWETEMPEKASVRSSSRWDAPTEIFRQVSTSTSAVTGARTVPHARVSTGLNSVVPVAPRPQRAQYLAQSADEGRVVALWRSKKAGWVQVTALLGLVTLSVAGFLAAHHLPMTASEAASNRKVASPPQQAPSGTAVPAVVVVPSTTPLAASVALPEPSASRPDLTPTTPPRDEAVDVSVASPTLAPLVAPPAGPTSTLAAHDVAAGMGVVPPPIVVVAAHPALPPSNTPVPVTATLVPPGNSPVPTAPSRASSTAQSVPTRSLMLPVPTPARAAHTPIPAHTAKMSHTGRATNVPSTPSQPTPMVMPPTSIPTDVPVAPAPTETALPPSDASVQASPTAAPSALESVVNQAIAGNPKAVANYLGGRKTALLTILGEIIQNAKGKIDLGAARDLLLKKLEELRKAPGDQG
ncbi:MAG: protein kinase [Chloroflexota bacterium]|nr:protein kinase [Chloroflexota bacterium]